MTFQMINSCEKNGSGFSEGSLRSRDRVLYVIESVTEYSSTYRHGLNNHYNLMMISCRPISYAVAYY